MLSAYIFIQALKIRSQAILYLCVCSNTWICWFLCCCVYYIYLRVYSHHAPAPSVEVPSIPSIPEQNNTIVSFSPLPSPLFVNSSILTTNTTICKQVLLQTSKEFKSMFVSNHASSFMSLMILRGLIVALIIHTVNT